MERQRFSDSCNAVDKKAARTWNGILAAPLPDQVPRPPPGGLLVPVEVEAPPLGKYPVAAEAHEGAAPAASQAPRWAV